MRAKNSNQTFVPADQWAQIANSIYGELLEIPLCKAADSATGPVIAPTFGLAGSASPAPPATETVVLANWRTQISSCQNCSLYLGRTNAVIEKGNPSYKICFVGDFPSLEDDRAGAPFVGEVGELLNKMIQAMHLQPTEAYLVNLVKCKPPGNREPDQSEFFKCNHFFLNQMSEFKGSILVALGEATSKFLSNTEAPLSVLRGQTFTWNGKVVYCTHHPRSLMKAPDKKRECWEDLKRVMKAIELNK